MLSFYRKALIAFSALLAVSSVLAYACIKKVFLHSPLLPATQSAMPWQILVASDEGSHIGVKDSRYSLDADFILGSELQYPYVSFSLMFGAADGQHSVEDLSRYEFLDLTVKCAPANTISFHLLTVDKQVTTPDDLNSYRTPSTFFSCEDEWSQVTIDLTRLTTPQWWFDKYGLDLSQVDYNLAEVAGVALSGTHQSPYDVESNLHIGEIVLHGRDWRYLYVYLFIMLCVWAAFVVWFFRQHSKALVEDIKNKLQKDRPLVAYQQLSISPQKSKDKSEILRFMSTEYANEDLSLDTVVEKVGVSRTKINSILKEELGYTFSAYLNKLRLTEAARLLSQSDEANVAEIAYSVGYKNVSYFNKLFKNEYGCTPKTFKSVYKT